MDEQQVILFMEIPMLEEKTLQVIQLVTYLVELPIISELGQVMVVMAVHIQMNFQLLQEVDKFPVQQQDLHLEF